jgi:hypothetical protein
MTDSTVLTENYLWWEECTEMEVGETIRTKNEVSKREKIRKNQLTVRSDRKVRKVKRDTNK